MKYSKPQAILAAGEDLEVHTYKAMPPGYVGSQKFGPGFINQVAFTPWDEGAHYVTISSDKSIKLINTESKECLVDKQACHKMGISELAFAAEAGVFYTASNDRTIKKWKIDFEAKSIEELSVLTLSAVDEQQYKENVDK
jgi:WD40 repeat protein|tara:strand:- start:8 stop:427 length:420 start_codon:yes stop_codon:yes gene_type:complete